MFPEFGKCCPCFRVEFQRFTEEVNQILFLLGLVFEVYLDVNRNQRRGVRQEFMNEAAVIFSLEQNVEDVFVEDSLSKIQKGNEKA